MSFCKIVELAPGVVTTATPWTSDEIVIRETGSENDYRRSRVRGYFSIDNTHTGGNLTVDLLCANGSTFKTPEGATSILAAKTAGGYFAEFSVDACRAFKLKFIATSSNCTVTECKVFMV